MTALPISLPAVREDSIAAANDRAASALIAALIEGGVRQVVISPGSRSTPLVLALHREERLGRLSLQVVLDERSAAFFALGLARASGAPSLIVATSGSAGAHALPAIIEASESGVPLLVITADRPPELQGAGAAQTIDQRRLFGAHVRAAIDLSVPDPTIGPRSFSAAATRAVLAATSSKPGPVQINAPFREPLWSEDLGANVTSNAAAISAGRSRLDRKTLQEIAADLGARRGVIVAGPIEGASARWPEIAAAFAGALGWPLLAEAGSQLRFGPHDRSSLITRYDAVLRAPELAAALAPERVITFGRAPCSKVLSRWLERYAADRTIAIAPAGAYADPHHLACRVISADLEETIEDLTLAIADRQTELGWKMRWREADRRAAAILDRSADQVSENAVASLVASLAPENGAIHAGNGMPVRDLDAFADGSSRSIAVFVSRGANGIDGTLSTAAGEAIARRAPLLLLIGDLAALHDLSGLRLLADTRAPVIAVVLDNGGGGIFDFLPISRHPSAYERCFLTPQRDDAAAIAEAIGLPVHRATTLDQVAIALRAALESRGPALIQVTIDREKNVTLHQERWAEVAQALDGWRRTWTSAG